MKMHTLWAKKSLHFLLKFSIILTPNILNKNILNLPTSQLMFQNKQEFLRCYLLLLCLKHYNKNILWFFGITRTKISDRVNEQNIFSSTSLIYPLGLFACSTRFKTWQSVITSALQRSGQLSAELYGGQ